ncbi:serine protease [Cytophagaceae bacterium ABcell3]|nr:serine protease [Cytophagaceae bacterium ABcell3]
MNEDVLILEKIDAWITGRMTENEKIAFEKELKSNPELHDLFQSQLDTYENFQLYGRRIELKKQLNKFHKEMLDEGIPPYKEAKTEKPPKRKVKKFNFTKLAVAASILLLLGWSFTFFSTYLKSLEESQSVHYKQLRRDLDKIKKYQSEILQDIHSADEEKNAPPVKANCSGSGFAISDNGYLVTSYHVVKGAKGIIVERSYDETVYPAKVVYKDKQRDLAILKIVDTTFTGFGNLAYTINESYLADLGERVYTLGFPKEDVVYGEGSISSSTGYEGDTTSYQISVPVNPGNSGGPLLDEKGQVIGIISGKHMGVESAAFAVKSQYLLQIIEELKADSLAEPINLPKYNQLKSLKRPQQIKKLKDNVFIIKVYS